MVKSVLGVGPVTVEVVLSEVGYFGCFRNAKPVCAYAGLAPVVRQSGGKRAKDLGISKEGSRLLRCALVEASLRLFRTSPSWSEFSSESRNGLERNGPSLPWP